MEEYTTVQKEASGFFVEKKSKFIGYCKPVKKETEALEYIAKIKKQNFDATHNVYAYIIQNENLKRFSDDGEPQGKAGIPVLDAMEKSSITDAVIVATRYFGGTMLGGGGLIRAYSHTASIAIAAAGKLVMRKCLLAKILCDYTYYGRVESLVLESGGVIDKTQFLENVQIEMHIADDDLNAFTRKLADATGGKAFIEKTGNEFFEFF